MKVFGLSIIFQLLNNIFKIIPDYLKKRWINKVGPKMKGIINKRKSPAEMNEP